jgi:hypothetical protein
VVAVADQAVEHAARRHLRVGQGWLSLSSRAGSVSGNRSSPSAVVPVSDRVARYGAADASRRPRTTA